MDIILEEKTKLVSAKENKIVITRFNGDIFEIQVDKLSIEDFEMYGKIKDFFTKLNESL